ncbi:alpha/beta hydrolase [Mycobacterium sp. GA-1841]|uniref:alpha/beta fold hydrolase n=1 Tax=Mycobacterium sp. GA-1841 TaxID=1834154 RepID=UPI00096DA691|nr:alpha/beta hydrolase [Mycobacterium sp. GA-1841]OMC41387.1 alpha/beta hydrolase [Mycobacterium sp. GA-1841]
MIAPTAQSLELSHLRFETLTWGPDDGRLMLCLHGYPDTAWTWRHLGPFFAQRGFRVVAPFMRGYAPTEMARDGDYGLGALMFDAIALHRGLDGGSDAVLVGHDWGALAANGIAAYPDSPFTKVVSMGVPMLAGLAARAGNVGELLRALPRQLQMSWYVLYQQLPKISERSLDRLIPKLWRDWCPPGYDSTADLAHVWKSLPDNRRRTAALNYYRAAFRPTRRASNYHTFAAYSRRIAPRVPMLHLHGHEDGAIDARLGALGAHALAPGSRHHIINGAGHFMHLDQPDEVHRLISDYVSI